MKYKIQFSVKGRSQAWERFYNNLAEAIRETRIAVERKYGKTGAIILSTEEFTTGWLA